MLVCGTDGTLHGVQADELWLDQEPTAQSNATVFPVPGQYLPAGHGVHVAAPPVEKDPAGQAVHAELPLEDANWPATQGVQVVAP